MLYPADPNVWRLQAVDRTGVSITLQWRRDGSSPTSPDIVNSAAAYVTIRNKLIFEGPNPIFKLHDFLKRLFSIYHAATWILDFKTYRWWRYLTEDFPRAIPSTASVISHNDYVIFAMDLCHLS
eukprot:m.218585 g.218585  ORF g.218585 m.218585 type:complete len:124 (+) comp39900_c1_seq9:2335-2706(+)